MGIEGTCAWREGRRELILTAGNENDANEEDNKGEGIWLQRSVYLMALWTHEHDTNNQVWLLCNILTLNHKNNPYD